MTDLLSKERLEKTPEWRKALNQAVENYQIALSWYEENRDSPSAQQDVEDAEGGIAKLISQYGVLIVLSLLDEIDEVQDRAAKEPVAWRCASGTLAERRLVTVNKPVADFWLNEGCEVVPLFTTPPLPVVPDDLLSMAASAIEDLLEHTDPNTSYYSGVWADVPGKLRAAMLQLSGNPEQVNSPVIPEGSMPPAQSTRIVPVLPVRDPTRVPAEVKEKTQRFRTDEQATTICRSGGTGRTKSRTSPPNSTQPLGRLDTTAHHQSVQPPI